MVEHATRTDGDASKDFFVVSSKHPLGHKLMQTYGLIEKGYETRCQPADLERGESSLEYLPGRQRRYTITEEGELARWTELRALWTRFWVSMVGGLGLIAPMLLMVLHRDRTTALATTSGSVFVFAAILTFSTRASPEIAIGAVAAYAAVLVVFVGSSLPASTA
jgi:hypothetical protein